MKILGISAYYHDSAAAIIIDGKIIAAVEEERFTRKKNDSSFPIHSIKFCLDYSGLTIDELDSVVFYDKPFLKFERLLETYYAFAPKGLFSFLKAMPAWLKEKLFFKKLFLKELKKAGLTHTKKVNLLFSEHHLSHAASAFYASSFKKAAILTIDGVGEWSTATICIGEGESITLLKELKFPHSVGLLYSAFTYYLGFKVNSGEYKLMGLAPYGNPDSDNVKKLTQIIKTELIEIKDDGSIWLNQNYFNYSTGLTMVKDVKWLELFNFPKRVPNDEINQNHCDLAYSIQAITEEIVIKMARESKLITGADYLCMAGGVALNCVANGKLLNENIFKDIFIQPAAGDSGGAIGAALAAYHIYYEQERVISEKVDSMNGCFLGPEFSDYEIDKLIKKTKAKTTHFEKFDALCTTVANHIANGKTIGWFQGRAEFGPRALGNRSILADARNSEMQKKLNLDIKNRESFRPFAPAILAEDVSNYYENITKSPYMLFAQPIKKSKRNKLPLTYGEKTYKEKLNFTISDLPATTHVDFSARLQTVHQETNPKFHQLISAYKKITDSSVLVNTSFNVRGEPIVLTPEDAYKCYMRTKLDYLVIGNYLFLK